MEIGLMTLSDYAFIGENGKLGVIGLFGLLGLQSFPGGHPEMFLCANVRNLDDTEHDVIVKIEDPTGQDLLAPNNPRLKVKSTNNGDWNLIQRFLNLTFLRPGIHRFVLLFDGKEIASINLSVVQISPASAGNFDGRGKTKGDNLPN